MTISAKRSFNYGVGAFAALSAAFFFFYSRPEYNWIHYTLQTLIHHHINLFLPNTMLPVCWWVLVMGRYGGKEQYAYCPDD